MKNTEQATKVAGPGEKVLPGGPVSVARESNAPVRINFIPASPAADPSAANATAVPAVANSTNSRAKLADDAVAVSNSSALRNPTVDRTHDLTALHALRLVDEKSDSLQVVIKPDAGTQLSLELRQRGGGIEAQAVLQSGDASLLKQHWPELQQRLEQRGIKLAPLTDAQNPAAGSGSEGFKNPHPPAESEPLLAGAFTRFAPVGAMNHLPAEPAVPAATSRGWQTWA